MNRPQRHAHRWSWPVLGGVLLVLVWLGLAGRRPEPIADQLPDTRADQRSGGAGGAGGDAGTHAPGGRR